MRGLLPALPTPHPLADTLPGVYQDPDRDFVRRFCTGLDGVLAPVLVTLDCLPAYLDPATAPADVLDWLAGWVGVASEGREVRRRRVMVRDAVALDAVRGTAAGVRRAVAGVFDGIVEVEEGGATRWSADPAAPLPGVEAGLTVRLRVPDPADVDVQRLDALVASVKPAHIPHRVVVTPSPD